MARLEEVCHKAQLADGYVLGARIVADDGRAHFRTLLERLEDAWRTEIVEPLIWSKRMRTRTRRRVVTENRYGAER